MTGTLFVLAAAVQIAGAAVVPNTHYFPVATGRPAGIVRGTLLAFDTGTSSGSLQIRRDDGRVVTLSIGANFRIDGVSVECDHAPIQPRAPSGPGCMRWPSDVRIGATRVIGVYRRARRYGRCDLYLSSLRTIHAAAPIPNALRSTRFARCPSNSP